MIMNMKTVAIMAVTMLTVSSPVLAGLRASCETGNDDAFCKDVGSGGDANAVCLTATETCTCTGAYKENSGNDACINKVLGDSCDASTDCDHLDNAECDTNCVCMAKYREVGAACVLTLGSTCTDDSQCTGVANTVCPTGDDRKCGCADNYGSKENDCVMTVTGTSCSSNTQCTADNSECDDNTKCKCKEGFMENVDECKEKNGVDGLSANIGMLCSMLMMLGLLLKL